MKEDLGKSLQARPEQIVYANILEKGMLLGLVVVLVTYFIYVAGIMKPYVPMDSITNYWQMNVHDYLHHCGIKSGWAWLSWSDMVIFSTSWGLHFLPESP